MGELPGTLVAKGLAQLLLLGDPEGLRVGHQFAENLLFSLWKIEGAHPGPFGG